MRRAAVFFVAVRLAAALACAAPGITRAAEPPAIVEPRPTGYEGMPRQYTFEGAVQAVFAGMGDWNDGLSALADRSRSDPGLQVATTNLPAYALSFDATALVEAAGPFMVGLQYDRPTGRSEFSVREFDPLVTDLTEYPTVAEASSNAWLLVARWNAPVRRGVHPFVQAGAGVGSARLTFSTSSGSAQGKGHAFAGNLEAGLHVGDSPVRLRLAAGWRLHRVPLSYSSVRAASQAGASRYFFDFDDELRDFASGRDVDLGGPFARAGVAVVWSR